MFLFFTSALLSTNLLARQTALVARHVVRHFVPGAFTRTQFSVLDVRPFAAVSAARRVAIWRLYLPLEGVVRHPRGPIAFRGDPTIPHIES